MDAPQIIQGGGQVPNPIDSTVKASKLIKKILIGGGVLVVAIVGIQVFLIFKNLNTVFNKSISTLERSKQANVAVKNEYENPFAQETQYRNPFVSQNPFDNLAQ